MTLLPFTSVLICSWSTLLLLIVPSGTISRSSSHPSNNRKQHDLLTYMQVFVRRWEIRWKKTGLEQGTKWKEVGKETRRQNNIGKKRERKTKVDIYCQGGWSRRLKDDNGRRKCWAEKKTEMSGSEAETATQQPIKSCASGIYVDMSPGQESELCHVLIYQLRLLQFLVLRYQHLIHFHWGFLHYLYTVFSLIHDPTVAIYILYTFPHYLHFLL